MVNDDLKDRLSALEAAAGYTGGGVVVLFDPPGEDDAGTVTHEPGESDPIDSYTEVVVPKHLPPGYRGGVTVLDAAELEDLWTEMPADVQECELERRNEAGDPIPDVLDVDRDAGGTGQ